MKDKMELKDSMSTKLLMTIIDNPHFFKKIPRRAFLIKKTKEIKIPAGSVYVGDNIYLVEANGKVNWEKLGGVKIFAESGYVKRLPKID